MLIISTGFVTSFIFFIFQQKTARSLFFRTINIKYIFNMPRILVIDDDPAISELVSINLEMAGYDVNQAEDGVKGQALAVQLQPDLVMLDLMLPKVDGFTVVKDYVGMTALAIFQS